MDLLITFGAAAAQRASNPRHEHRLHVDLDVAAIEDVSQHKDRDATSITIIASTWSDLRTIVQPLRVTGSTKDVRVRVLDELAPTAFLPAVWPGIAGRLVEFNCKTQRDEGTTIRLRLSRPSPVHSLVGFFVTGPPGVLTPPLRMALTHRDAEPWAVGNPSVRYAGIDDVIQTGGVSVPLTEVLVSPATDREPPGTIDLANELRPRLVVATAHSRRPTAPTDPAMWLPGVDTRVVNPAEFDIHAAAGTGRVAAASDRSVQVLADDGRELLRVARMGRLGRPDVDRVRTCQYVICRGDATDPSATAGLLCQLAAAGVPVDAAGLAPQTRDLLGVEMSAALNATQAEDLEDPLLREAASIRVRRAALRAHGSGPRLRQLGRRAGYPVAHEPTVSIILMTKRPQMLTAALAQVRAQTYPHMQLVLGLHGDHFDEAVVASAVADVAIPSVTVQVPADVPFGEALNRATVRCDGRLVTKWDDDDLYGSEHIWDLVLAADYSGAAVVGKAAEFTVVTEAGTTIRRNNRGSERMAWHVAGGTILLRRETLQAVGGWSRQPRYVDDALLRQVRDAGGTVYRTHGFGYLLVRHNDGHTWDPGTEYFLSGDGRRWPLSSPLQQVALEQAWDRDD